MSRSGRKAGGGRCTSSTARPLTPPVTAFAVRQAVLESSVLPPPNCAPGRRAARNDRPVLPHLEHPELGALTGSTANFDRGGIRQIGHKPGTVGQPLPGVALRVVDESGTPLPPDAEGLIQALLPHQPGWAPTGLRGRLDRDGFFCLAAETPAPIVASPTA